MRVKAVIVVHLDLQLALLPSEAPALWAVGSTDSLSNLVRCRINCAVWNIAGSGDQAKIILWLFR